MPYNSQLPADSSKLRSSAGYLRDNFSALETYLGLANLNAGTPLQFFPSGTKLWFYQDTAPTGWTIVSGVSDCLIGIKGTSGATYATGGTVAGTWQTPDHTLTLNEIPSHTHGYNEVKYVGGGNFDWGVSFENPTAGPINTTSAGGGMAHNHGNTWRPVAAIGIIAVKT